MPALSRPPTLQEGLQHLPEEGVGDRHHVGDVLGDQDVP